MRDITGHPVRDSLAYAGALTLLSVVGRLALLPYYAHFVSQLPDARHVDIFWQIVSIVLDATLSYVLIRISLRAARRLDLAWPPLDGWRADLDATRRRRDAIVTAILLGAAIALAVGVALTLVSDRWPMRAMRPPPMWVAALGSLGAGIYEEIWFRLGAMTLVAWVITRLMGGRVTVPRSIWIANAVAAVLFGAAHLPQARTLTALTPSLTAVILAANACVGIACGWLYWRRGLVAAMIAHATVDLVLKVGMPLMVPF